MIMSDTNKKTTLVKALEPRFTLVERDCPRCDSVIMENEKEGCYECIQCGYIDCGSIRESQ
jgi:ribosomal protein S27AE